MKPRLVTFITLCIMVGGCGLFDSGVVWRGGPYALGWIDIPEDVTLSYDLGKGASISRIPARVFAVGWDGHYLVAKQHPNGDKKITNYFIIDATKDGRYADPKNVVAGPFTESEFVKESADLRLPGFSKELASLR